MFHRNSVESEAAFTVMNAKWLICAGTICAVLLHGVIFAQGQPDVIWMQTNIFGFSLPARGIAFSPNGSLLACMADVTDGNYVYSQKIDLRRTEDGVVVRSLTNSYSAPALSPDGTSIAFVGTNGLGIWRVSDGVALRCFTNTISDSADPSFSPNGDILADTDGTHIRLWRVADGTLLRQLPVELPDRPLFVFSPDSQYVATQKQLWRVADGQIVRSWQYAYGMPVVSLAISPDGAWLTRSYQGEGGVRGTLGLTRVADGKLLWERDTLPGEWPAAIFSNDGSLLGVNTLYTPSLQPLLRFLRASDGNPISYYDQFWFYPSDDWDDRLDIGWGSIHSLVFSPNGQHYAYVGQPRNSDSPTFLVMARRPLWISTSACTNNQASLQWSGGSGLFQVQQITNLTTGAWANVGAPTTNTSFTFPATNPATFFRIQSLSNAP